VNELITIRTLDSREVAEMLGKNHAHLCRDIAKYIEVISENPKLDSLKYFIPSTFKVDGNNKTYVCYKLTKMGCEFVGNKMTGDKGILFTAAYVQRFNDMESQDTAIATQQERLKVQQSKAEASLLNARTKQAQMLLTMANASEVVTYREILIAKATNLLAGENLLPMPVSKVQRSRHGLGYFCRMIGKKETWATVMGKELKKAGIEKIPGETGEFIEDTSKHGGKQVQTFEWFDDYLEPIVTKMFTHAPDCEV
jgi:Rha family phage regulatory protein